MRISDWSSDVCSSDLVHKLRAKGTTIILTTHYIEEAEEMADRVGVINKGRIIVVDEKAALMAKLGKREMTILLQEPMAAIPSALGEWDLTLDDDGKRLVHVFDAKAEHTGIPSLLRTLGDTGIGFNKGRINGGDEKAGRMEEHSKREKTYRLQEPMAASPSALGEWDLTFDDDGKRLVHVFDAKAEHTGIPSLLRKLGDLGIGFNDLETSKSSLEDIFVDLVHERQEQAA